jgi:hypothetical protein
MPYRAADAATEQRALAKTIKFQLTLSPTGAATFAAVSVPSDDMPAVAGAVTSGAVGVLTDAVFAGISTNGAPAKIGIELKDGYARKFIAFKATCKTTSGAGNVGRGSQVYAAALADGQITANGHVAAVVQPEALTFAAAAGTMVFDCELTYE